MSSPSLHSLSPSPQVFSPFSPHPHRTKSHSPHLTINRSLVRSSTLYRDTVYHRVQVDSRISRRAICWGKCVQNCRFKYKSNQKFGKNKRQNDAKLHRSTHYTVESLVLQSTISPDMLVKTPNFKFLNLIKLDDL